MSSTHSARTGWTWSIWRAREAQVRFRAARDGWLLHEAHPGIFGKFWMEAVDFWCDAEPLLRAGYAQALARLRR